MVLPKSQGQGGWRGSALKRPRLRINIADQYLQGMCWHLIVLVCALGAACRAGAVRSGLWDLKNCKNGFRYKQKLRVVAAVNEWPNKARFKNWHRAIYAAS